MIIYSCDLLKQIFSQLFLTLLEFPFTVPIYSLQEFETTLCGFTALLLSKY